MGIIILLGVLLMGGVPLLTTIVLIACFLKLFE